MIKKGLQYLASEYVHQATLASGTHKEDIEDAYKAGARTALGYARGCLIASGLPMGHDAQQLLTKLSLLL